MLISGSQLIGTPIMGLQTGTKLATTKMPIIDPSSLKIIAYEVEGPMLVDSPAYLLIADVREISGIGMIIDSNDEFVSSSDVIALQKILELKFNLIDLDVIDESKRKLGKVADYTLDTDSFVIQQLNVKRGLIKSLSETELLIHRKQIVEVNDHFIKVKSGLKKLDPISKPSQLTYMNPFRSPNTEAR